MKSKKKALFICGTTYHVISSIFLRYQLNIESDIYIYDAFSNINMLVDGLDKEKVFDKIRIITDKKDFGMPDNIIMRYVYAFGGYFKIKTIIEKSIPHIKEYSDVFFANDIHSNVAERFIYCYIKKYSSNTNIHYLEDGLGSYHEDYYNLTSLDYFCRKMLVKGDSFILDMDIFLYSPELYKLINPNGIRNIKQIIKPEKKVIDIIKKVFSYIVLEDLSQYNMIVFDTVRKEAFTKNGDELFNELIKIQVGDNKAIVKQHPREKNKYFEYDYFQTDGFPFEILCLFNDFSNFTFINNYSNAVFTPKILFDQEPRIIFTYKFLKKYMQDKSDDEDIMISKFKELYTDNSKIIVLEE